MPPKSLKPRNKSTTGAKPGHKPSKSSGTPAAKRGRGYLGSNPRAPEDEQPKKKIKPEQRTHIEIPNAADSEEEYGEGGEGGMDVDEEDVEWFGEGGERAPGFLRSLDKEGIALSKQELARRHDLTKPKSTRPKRARSPSPSSSHSTLPSDLSDLSTSDLDASDLDDLSLSEDEEPAPARRRTKRPADSSDEEQSYERTSRVRAPSPPEAHTAQRLPIKLPSGQVAHLPADPFRSTRADSSEEESDEEEEQPKREEPPRSDVAFAARFGRPAVADVVGRPGSRKERVELAKVQIASLAQEVIGDPDNNLPLLRRLLSFSLSSIPPPPTAPPGTPPTPNDPLIRKLAHLSLAAVYCDIIPGYRIRALTDAERAEKVGQDVARRREWEEGLVKGYQAWLGGLEGEVRKKTDLASTALRCLCTMLEKATHFNFRTNIMEAIVSRMSRRSWDEDSALCLSTITTVFASDLSGSASLELVRLLNRMVKERRFAIHPNVLSSLLHLRLRDELAPSSVNPSGGDDVVTRRKGNKGKDGKVHLSKKEKKRRREVKEIEKEMKEAEAEVDKEGRDRTHTETLKLLFVLYFRILKNPEPRGPAAALLPAALEGVARFAHLVNVDFFKDLLDVLKQISKRVEYGVEGERDDEEEGVATLDGKEMRLRLLCVGTAFELLTGQGDALNIDLDDFVTSLYALLLPLSLSPTIEDHPPNASSSPSTSTTSGPTPYHLSTESDLLFRALHLVFFSRSSKTRSAPPIRALAFAKRLLLCALHWPSATALRALQFIARLLGAEGGARLEGMLSTEERGVGGGVYKAEWDDPQGCNPQGALAWELGLLEGGHVDARVREDARRLANWEVRGR